MRKLLLVLVATAATLGLVAGPAAARDRSHDDNGHGRDARGWSHERTRDHRRDDHVRRAGSDPGEGRGDWLEHGRIWKDHRDSWHHGDPASQHQADIAARQAAIDAKRAAVEAAKAEAHHAGLDRHDDHQRGKRNTDDPARHEAPASGQEQAQASGSLTIVHAIPALVVDVYVDGELVAPGVEFGSTQTLELPSGVIRVELREAGSAPTDTALLSQRLTIKPAVAKSFVAYLDATGEVEDDVFYDNITQNRTMAQLTVRHLAAAPAVDVYVNGQLTFEGLSNAAQQKAFVEAGTYTVMITAAGDPATVVLPDTQVTLEARTNTIVSATGDLAAGTFATVQQVLAMDLVRTDQPH
jgi:hypothetical protein